MNRDQLTTELTTFIPPALWHRAVVAGGAAADLARAEDIDLWVYGFTNLDEAVERLEEHLNASGIKWDNPKTKVYDGFGESELDNSEVAVVATLYSDMADLPVQLIACRHQTPTDILETFDLSIHMWAYSLSSPVAMGIARSTSECAPIRVERVTTPNRTTERYLRLCKRYGQEPQDSQLKLLGEEKQRRADARRDEARDNILKLWEGPDDDSPF